MSTKTHAQQPADDAPVVVLHAPAAEPARPVAVARWLVGRVGRFASTVWLFLALLALWEWRASASESLFFPTVTTILSTVRDEFFSGPATRLFLSDAFTDNVWPSLGRAGRGWLIALVVGVTFGIVIGVSRVASECFSPLIRFGMSVPATVLLPLAIVLFGVTDSMNVFLIAFGSVWVILVNTIDGVRNIDSTVMATARSLRLSRRTVFFRVLLPGASPSISAGVRVSIGISLILMVVSELFAATSGVGYYIVFAQRTFRYNQVWAGVFLLATIGIVANLLYKGIERRALRWYLRSQSREG